MEHLFFMFLDHTQRRSTVGRAPLDDLITRPEDSYRLCCVVVCDLETSRMGAPYIYDISRLRVKLTLTILELVTTKMKAARSFKILERFTV